MAKTTIKVQLEKGNVGRFLRSRQVADVLRRPAERIKAAADAGSGDAGHNVHVVQGHKDRVIAIISAGSPKARKAEAESRNLTRSLDAGRG